MVNVGTRSGDLNKSYLSNESLSRVRRWQPRGPRMILDPSTVPARQGYRLMISAFIPRPIAFVSTVSRDGVDNCAPFSFSMGVSGHPVVLAVSVGERDTGLKDTARNILDTREFVVNLVTEALADKMNIASGDYAENVSEFDEAGMA